MFVPTSTNSSVCLQAGKPATASDNPAGDVLDDDGTAATRNRFVVVDDRLRGDEELAIAILEKAVLGETVMDRDVLEQLKAYIRGGGGAGDSGGKMIDSVVGDIDNLSVSSSSEEGDMFEDACGDVSSHALDTVVTQFDGLDVTQKQLVPTNDMSPMMMRTPAEGLDAAAAQALAKVKDRPITKGKQSVASHASPSLGIV